MPSIRKRARKLYSPQIDRGLQHREPITIGAPPKASTPLERPLPLDAVRREATNANLTELGHDASNRVVLFAPSLDDSPQFMRRVRVYYNTGTVSVYTSHPIDGKTRKYHLGADLAKLRRVMMDPKIHECDRWYRCRGAKGKTFGHPLTIDDWSDGPGHHELVNEREAARVRVEELREEHDALKAKLDDKAKQLANAKSWFARADDDKYGDVRQRRADALRAKVEAKRLAMEKLRDERGRYQRSRVRDADALARAFDDTCVCIGTNGTCSVLLFEDGRWRTVGDVSALTKLKTFLAETDDASSVKPTFVSLGPNGRFYVERSDGRHACVGPDELRLCIDTEAEQRGGVASVAFGRELNWFLVFRDGSWRHGGMIHAELNKALWAAPEGVGVKRVALGCGRSRHDDPWFIEFSDGDKKWGGCCPNADKELSKLGSNRVRFVDFGEDERTMEGGDLWRGEGRSEYLVRYT